MNANKPIGKTYANRASNAVTTGYRTTRNTSVATYHRFRGLNLALQIVIVVLIIVALIFLILWIKHLYDRAQYKAQESPFIVTEPINAFSRSGRPVKTQRVPRPVNGLNFTYSLWIYIADWNYNFGKWKNIFIKGNESQRAPGLWLYPKTNSLHARINTHADYNEGCDIRNIPLQKWVHIVYVLNNRTVDIYVDGKLERSCVLRGVPVLNDMPVRVADGGGYYGSISKFQYMTRPLTPNDVAEIYSEGPYVSKRYKIDIFDDAKKELGRGRVKFDAELDAHF